MDKIDYLKFSDFEDDVILIKINKRYKEGISLLELYESTRGYWKRKLESVKDTKYALSIYNGIVKEVYEIDSWHESGFYPMETRETKIDNSRIEFVGKVANEEIRQIYIGKSVVNLYKQGEVSPVKVIRPVKERVIELNVDDLIEYKYITDILNPVFGNDYGAWMKATWSSVKSECNFRVWFPQLSLTDADGNPKAAAFDCINTISDDWESLTYLDLKEDVKCDVNPYLGYDLVFAKEPKGNYIFRGVYKADVDTLTEKGFTSRRLAKKVKLFGSPVNRIELIDDKNSKSNIRIKTECILKELLSDFSNCEVNIKNKVNTTVLCNDEVIMDIYYRQNEIRINIKEKGTLIEKYKSLKSINIAFQKETANPNATKGQFAFFVNENNIEQAMVVLLLTINDKITPKDIVNNIVHCKRCNYSFKKAKRCPNCGQLIKYEV